MLAAERGLGLDLYHFIRDPQPESLLCVHGEALGVAAVAFDAQHNSYTGFVANIPQ